MTRDIHFLVDVQNAPVLANVERLTTWDLDRSVVDPKRRRDLAVRVAQNWKIEFQFLGEAGVGIDRITTGRKVSDIELTQQLAVLTERNTLFRSAASERLRIPGNHHWLLAVKLGQRICFAIAANEFEIRSLVTWFELGMHSPGQQPKNGDQTNGRPRQQDCAHRSTPRSSHHYQTTFRDNCAYHGTSYGTARKDNRTGTALPAIGEQPSRRSAVGGVTTRSDALRSRG